jgi:hypothetical protein
MIQSSTWQRFVRTLDVGLALLLLAAALIASPQAVQAGLPPRQTPQPLPPSGSDGGGASLELRLRFDQVEQAARWQELWTVVQWQDASGNWRDVEGWQGALDEMAKGEGVKVWWVYRQDLGTGPFRWMIYSAPAGKVLAASDPFHLPRYEGATELVTVRIAP